VGRLRQLSPTGLAILVAGVGAGVALGGALLFAKLTQSVLSNGGAVSVDVRMYHWVLDHRTAWVTDVMTFVTHLASGLVVAAITAAVVVWSGIRRRWGDAAFMVSATAGAAVLTLVAKHLVGRARPETANQLVQVTGAAFPSAHAAEAVACYGALAFLVTIWRRSIWVAVSAWASAGVLAAAIGWSRVYLGVHWLSDVVAGWALGLSWLAVLISGLATYRALESRRAEPSPEDSGMH
jgi:undecaprenyl-diphosphatase